MLCTADATQMCCHMGGGGGRDICEAIGESCESCSSVLGGGGGGGDICEAIGESCESCSSVLGRGDAFPSEHGGQDQQAPPIKECLAKTLSCMVSCELYHF